MADLTRPTSNFASNLYANSKQERPVVGMGATELCYTDRHAYTITEIVSDKEIVVTEDRAIRTDANGKSDQQSYRYERDENGRVRRVTLRRNGRWIVKGQSSKTGTCFAIGTRSKYHDFSF